MQLDKKNYAIKLFNLLLQRLKSVSATKYLLRLTNESWLNTELCMASSWFHKSVGLPKTHLFMMYSMYLYYGITSDAFIIHSESSSKPYLTQDYRCNKLNLCCIAFIYKYDIEFVIKSLRKMLPLNKIYISEECY